jgi:hypothetical protein
MRVVIMAAGDGQRWKNYLGVPKHFAPVDGVPLLHRTVGLLREAGKDDIYITVRAGVTHADLPFTKRYVPTDSEFEIDRIWGARVLVEAPTVFLYGDAYYTDNAIRTIVQDAAGYHFFGRSRPSRSKPFGKVFGIRVDDYVLSKAQVARELYREGRLCRCIGWELYGLCVETPGLGTTKKYFFSEADDTSKRFTEILDETEDFNEPFEFERWRDTWSRS